MRSSGLRNNLIKISAGFKTRIRLMSLLKAPKKLLILQGVFLLKLITCLFAHLSTLLEIIKTNTSPTSRFYSRWFQTSVWPTGELCGLFLTRVFFVLFSYHHESKNHSFLKLFLLPAKPGLKQGRCRGAKR